MSSAELRKAGLKVTLPRVKILEILANSEDHHLSAEDIYKKLLDTGDDVGIATVYRVLTQFEEAGLVVKHRFETGHSIFELNDGDHHDHLVCVRCNKVVEFTDDVIEKRQADIATEAGFDMTDHCLYIYGICADCQQE